MNRTYFIDYYHEFGNINIQSLIKQIRTCDFLISDKNSTHRLVGVKFNENMLSPQVCCIVCHIEVMLAVKLAVIFGKRIFQQDELSARIFLKYCCGENITDYIDLFQTAQLYAKFYCIENKNKDVKYH